ncbi:hypothetical protein LguiB_004850 [Lonicera macranthoides]
MKLDFSFNSPPPVAFRSICHLQSIPIMSLHNSCFSRGTAFVNISAGLSFVWIFTSLSSCLSITSRIQ